MSILTTQQLHLAELVRLYELRRASERKQRRDRLADAIVSCFVIGLFLACAFAMFWLGLLASGSN